MKKALVCVSVLALAGLVYFGARTRGARAGGTGETLPTSAARAVPPPQQENWVEPIRTDLLLTRYLDENSEVAITDFNLAAKTVRPVEAIQGKLWFAEGDASKVPFGFALEVTDHPGRLVLMRKQTDPAADPSVFMGKATTAEVRRMQELAKEPYTPRGERIQAFLDRWSDVVLVRCDQIAGTVRDFYAYKGDHFKSNADINRHQDLIIQDAYQSSYMGHSECILYGNFDQQPAEAHVVWIVEGYLIFPGRQSLFGMDFMTAASKLRKK